MEEPTVIQKILHGLMAAGFAGGCIMAIWYIGKGLYQAHKEIKSHKNENQ